ncbi:hypothetical protein EUBSIR_01903 [[Eubacterium] siraeum DSM 15702]|uniref:Uncharacterized protein n=1 Tax=[Eubacterium] siraeum DSM 15702 TaxID=428128 RepID=B0MPV0_9FIRM|nr:hypothetical protein EUBSIR_01903 [[Eubacterium] siraeum DSM 15702]
MAQVALFTRAWIEMITNDSNTLSITSPSSRGRGLKFEDLKMRGQVLTVALFTRAWIEITQARFFAKITAVALFTRAWIEIAKSAVYCRRRKSPSSRGRGLKCSADTGGYPQ